MRTPILLGVLLIALSAGATARTYNEPVQEETKTITIVGDVVRYEPGHLIVIRNRNNEEVTYTLASDANLPADIHVGKRVTVYTEPSAEGGATVVKRVTMTSVTPEGQTMRTTEETRTEPSGATTTTTSTTVSGTVEAYTAGKSVTVLQADGSRVTYTIDPQSSVPEQVVVGKTITIVPIGRKHVVKTITIRER